MNQRKTTVVVAILIVAPFLLLTCANPYASGPDGAGTASAPDSGTDSAPDSAPDSGTDSAPAESTIDLPDDVVNDRARSSGEFNFESFVPVALDLRVEVVTNTKGLPPMQEPVIITAREPDGSVLFRTSAFSGDTARGFLGLPTTLGSVELVFGGTYVQERVISIEDPADLDTISRVIYLEYAPPAASARSASGTTDSDGDGIPDVYDAEPSNPDVDFVTSYPADGSFTVAFEDNYPNLGDGDFNDFVVSYNLDIRERGGNLAGISGSATARARAAGYDHEFGILIHIPGFSGKITSYYETPAGVQIVQQQVATGEDVRIVVFPNTKQAFDRPTDRVTADNGYPDKTDSVGYRSTFFVSVDPGVEVSVDDVQAAPFNPYLLAHPTGYDAHLIGQRPLPPPTAEEPDRNTIPSDEDFRDGNGYPWALLVPADVAHPVEGLDVPSGTPIISAAYPRFDSWVSSLGDTDRDWYVDYVAGKVVILP